MEFTLDPLANAPTFTLSGSRARRWRLSRAWLRLLRPLMASGAALSLGACAVYPPPPVAVGQGTVTYSSPTEVTSGYAAAPYALAPSSTTAYAVSPYTVAPYAIAPYPAAPYYYGSPYYVGPPISLGLWFGHGGGRYHGWPGWHGHRGGHWSGHPHGGFHRGGGRHR